MKRKSESTIMFLHEIIVCQVFSAVHGGMKLRSFWKKNKRQSRTLISCSSMAFNEVSLTKMQN